VTGERYRALLIGNWHYPEDPRNLPDLKGPVNDVSGLGRILSEQTISLFSPADITILTERASYEISAALEELFTTAMRHDVLLIYYSGHGITADNGSLLLCGRDTRIDRKLATTVSAETITRMIDQSAAAATIIVLDCCYAGAFKSGDVASELGGRGRYVLAATRSRDRAPDAEHGTGFSRFTAHLLRGLEGAAAAPGSPYVTISDLYQYVRRKMSEDGPFVPQRRFDGDGDPALVRTGHPTLAGDNTSAAVALPATPRRRRRLLAVTVGALVVIVTAGAALAATNLPGQPLTGSQVGKDSPEVQSSASLAATPGVTSTPTASARASAPPTAATPTRRVAPKATATADPGATTAAVTVSAGGFSSPSSGATVKDCSYFSGSSRLAAGQTLILAMRNLDNGDTNQYVEYVFGWDKPATLTSWRGAQYFSGAAGQRYRIALMAVDLDAARAAKNDADASNALADQGVQLAAREVVREDGTVSNNCVGP
jgi:hypothetical protein